jgi:F420-dependent oxidoreductase-like protein
MRFSIWPSPNQSFEDVLATARHAEATGWDGVYVPDHFMPAGPDLDTPVLECWTVIAALAPAVPRLRIGALVSGNTYRHPAVLANMAATADRVSGGRIVLGIGAGWQENEHRAYGIAFPSVAERLARLEEACQVLRMLLGQRRASFEGRYYRLEDAPLEPKPVQQPLPLLVGGGGERVTLRIAARFADEWNTWGTPEVLEHKGAVLDRHCAAVGRDPAEIRRSAQALVYVSEDEAWLERRRSSPPPMPAVIGTPEEVRSVMAAYAKAGVDEVVVPDWNFGPLERKLATMDLLRSEVIEPLR